MVEIINLFDGQEGIKVHSNITVVSDQLNTGKAEFDLPNMETLRWVYNKATRPVRTNSSQTTFEECLSNFKLRLKARGYPNNFIERSLTGVRLEDRRLALQQRKKAQTKVLPLFTTYHPAVRGLKEILMYNWVVIQNQPLLKSM